MIFEPLDFISKLAALIPIPRINLVRFHGVFGPNSRDREAIVPHKKNHTIQPSADDTLETESEKRVAMNWARRLKLAFQIDIQKCEACGGRIKIIACIEDPVVIKQILSHLKLFAMNDQTKTFIRNFYTHHHILDYLTNI